MNLARSELLELKNLGMASVNILHAVGIHSAQELEEIGAVEAFLRIKARGIHTSKVMLYALQGALMNIHWNDLPSQMKSELVEQVERSAHPAAQASA